jgi:hypothetical protein
MLRYEQIYEVSGARRRLSGPTNWRRDPYAWRQDGRNREADQLMLFTFEIQGLADSAHNLEFLMATARAHDQQYVILTDTKIQIAGQQHSDQVVDRTAPREWQRDFVEWMDSDHSGSAPTVESTQHGSANGSVVTLQTWRHCFCLKEHQGVYDVTTGRRMTNRETIIRAFWDLGFATWRGRPYSIARLRWSGEREELEELADLARRYSLARYRSDVARKIVSAYHSINRYAAWPGSW